MGNTSSSNSRRPARATPIPEVHAVPLTRLTTELPIIMESKIAEQAEVILNQEGELRRLRNENAELQASNDRLVLEMNRFSFILVFIFCTVIAVIYKYYTNGVFALEYNFRLNKQTTFMPSSSPSTSSYVDVSLTSRNKVDDVTPTSSLSPNANVYNTNTKDSELVNAMRTMFASAFDIALLLYVVGISVAFIGYIVLLDQLDLKRQYTAKFFTSMIFQYMFHMVGLSIIKEQEVQGSMMFICSTIAVFASFHEGCQIILDRFILTRLRRNQQHAAATSTTSTTNSANNNNNNNNVRDMNWGIFFEYVLCIIFDTSASRRFGDIPDVKRKKYLQDGVYNLLISSFATFCTCVYYYYQLNPFPLYIILGFVSLFVNYVMWMILIATFLNRRSISKWKPIMVSFGGIVLTFYLVNEYGLSSPMIFDKHLHITAVIYLFLPYLLVYPKIYKTLLGKTLNLSTASSTLELMIVSISFLSLSLMLQTYIFIIPHYVAMLSALVIKYGKYVYYERKQVLRGRQNTAVRELRELTKIEKLLDVFSMNMFVYLTLIIGLNELSRRTFQFHKDKYLIALVGFTGKAVQIQIILKFFSRIFISSFICAGYWVYIQKSLPISFERSIISWIVGLMIATFANYELNGSNPNKLIVYMYDILTFSCFSTYAIQEGPQQRNPRSRPNAFLYKYFGLTFDNPMTLIYNCYYGLRIASVIPNFLGIPFSCIYIIPSISALYFYSNNFSENFRANDTRIVKPMTHRLLGLCISCFVMIVAIQLQSKILALICCLGIYMFVGSVCLSIGANDTNRLFIIVLCGLATILSAKKMDRDFLILSENISSFTPHYIQYLFTLFFGSISSSANGLKEQPFDLKVVGWILGKIF